MSLPYYKRFPRDFIDGTIGLDLEVKGAYAIVLDLIYMRDGRLEDDSKYISGQLGCSVRKWRSILEFLVSKKKLSYVNGFISNSRADKLMDEQRSFVEKQSENGNKPKKNKVQEKPELKPNVKPNSNQSESEPESKNKKQDDKSSLKENDLFETDEKIIELKINEKRATRFVRDAYPNIPDHWILEANKIGLDTNESLSEFEQFSDYWTAKGGKDATKLDWPATWRQWCRNYLKRNPRRGGNAFGDPRPQGGNKPPSGWAAEIVRPETGRENFQGNGATIIDGVFSTVSRGD